MLKSVFLFVFTPSYFGCPAHPDASSIFSWVLAESEIVVDVKTGKLIL